MKVELPSGEVVELDDLPDVTAWLEPLGNQQGRDDDLDIEAPIVQQQAIDNLPDFDL